MKHAGSIFVGFVFVAGAGALFAACGGSQTTDNGSQDGGGAGQKDAIASETSTVDTTPIQTVMDSATCDLSSDLTTSIPDAAIDEAGTMSTGLCLACVNQASTCKSDIDQCNLNCDCKSVVGDVITCIAKGGSQLACAAMAAGISSDAQTIGYALLACVNQNCSKECTPPTATKDGGGADGSDGSDGS
jgi:hypothetical protein